MLVKSTFLEKNPDHVVEEEEEEHSKGDSMDYIKYFYS